MESKIEVLKVIAHPARIAILKELANGMKCVADLNDIIEVSQPNLSQHLTNLRHAGIIDFFVDGRLRCYFMRDPLVPDLLMLLEKEYTEELPAPECCPVTRKGTYEGERNR